jgi:hypothetical protein
MAPTLLIVFSSFIPCHLLSVYCVQGVD